jgi:hypothetical protein
MSIFIPKKTGKNLLFDLKAVLTSNYKAEVGAGAGAGAKTFRKSETELEFQLHNTASEQKCCGAENICFGSDSDFQKVPAL